ncbi:recombination protein NinB [Paraburkholderia silviterrae]|uniref:Recombinase n=1 Tax=Paraburkholderia silviterrae TaxID=2528715 RepID=A0A4R5MF54_9BURK|nr:recombination protein NinB [Paraburkholderia silviterrae]TDG25878.1 recombinase [Paraburkholderia silviterrae]
MSARLYKEFVLSGPAVWQLVKELVREHAKAYIERGTPLRVIFTTEERRRSVEANAHYWGYVLRSIAEQAWVNDRQFDADTWHEYYAGLYCPKVEFVLPTGEIATRRKSTSEMGQKEFAEYVTRVQSNAAQEHAVEFTNGF